MKTCADLQETSYTPANGNASPRWLCDSAKNLKKRALAGTIAADDAEHLAPPNLEAHIAQSPELLDFVALHDLAATHEIEAFPREVASFPGDDVAQRNVAFALGRLVADQITFGNIFGSDDGVGHSGRMTPIRSDRR